MMHSSTVNLYISGRNPIHDYPDLASPPRPHSAHAGIARPTPLSIRTDNLPLGCIDDKSLPRLSAVKSKADDFLHHLDVLKEATRMTIASSLVDYRHARLLKSEKVLLLESLVERGREVGDGRPLDQLVESVLDDIRSSWSAFASDEPSHPAIPVSPPKARSHSAMAKTGPPNSSKASPGRAREYDSGETEQALASLEAFKKKIRKMKAQGLKVDTVLDEPSIMKKKHSLSTRHRTKPTIAAAAAAATAKDKADSPCPPPGTPLAAWELDPPVSPQKQSVRARPQTVKSPKMQDDDDEAHMQVKFIARPVPPSSLVPKFDKIMRQAEERRKLRVQQVKHELQGKVKPFAFEYSSMLQKRREASKSTRPTASPTPKRKPAPRRPPSSPPRPPKPPPPSSHDPTPNHTFRPHINSTIPDFAATHMHFSSLLARSRKAHAPPTPRPFRGVEMRQRVFEERKKRTLARVMRELKKDEAGGRRPATRVGKAHAVEGEGRACEVGPAPKTTRATELTLAARKAKDEARAKQAEDERMAHAHRAAKEAAMAAVIREAMDSSARKRMVKGAARAGSKREAGEEGAQARMQMARATREYATFLEAMEARLSARPLTLEQVGGGAEGMSVREQAKKIAEEKIAKILAELELDSVSVDK